MHARHTSMLTTGISDQLGYNLHNPGMWPRLLQVVRGLPCHQKEALRLIATEHLTITDAARIAGVSKETLSEQYKDALQAIFGSPAWSNMIQALLKEI
jgi:DNA-directed RNA polymerase specialized sigma24 family protein